MHPVIREVIGLASGTYATLINEVAPLPTGRRVVTYAMVDAVVDAWLAYLVPALAADLRVTRWQEAWAAWVAAGLPGFPSFDVILTPWHINRPLVS